MARHTLDGEGCSLGCCAGGAGVVLRRGELYLDTREVCLGGGERGGVLEGLADARCGLGDRVLGVSEVATRMFEQVPAVASRRPLCRFAGW